MGRMAPSAVVVLGNVASGGVHVRVDRVGTVSLCGGCVWWRGDGNVGIRVGQLGDEKRWTVNSVQSEIERACPLKFVQALGEVLCVPGVPKRLG